MSVFKKLIIIPMYFVLTCSFAQISIVIDNQEDIDNFAQNFPDLKELKSLSISGQDITDLSGLQQINIVLRYIHIYDTNLESLNGLENITRLDPDNFDQGQIWICDNPQLQSLDGLRSLDMPKIWGRITICRNPLLAVCNQGFICDMVTRHQLVWIFENAIGCGDLHQIQTACNINVSPLMGASLLHESFEDWVGDAPLGYSDDVIYTENVPNVERLSALSEGDHALLLRSNVPFFEGNLDTRYNIPLEDQYPILEISFTYQCLGTGWCVISTGQSFQDSVGANLRSIWIRSAGDSTVHKTVLRLVKPNEPFEVLQSVFVIASPYWTSLGSFGVSEFIIDDLQIRAPLTNSVSFIPEDQKIVFPNPSTGTLQLKEYGNRYRQFRIYNLQGELCAVGDISNGVINFDQKGLHYLELFDDQNKQKRQVEIVLFR